MYPTKLDKIINLFDSLPEDERRETLVSYADSSKNQEPRTGENFDLVDVRKDEECTDTVGVYLHVDENGKAHIRMTLGPEVQTLTRSMAAILCKGLDGATPQEILDLPSDFVTRIVGTELVRVRSQTVYYVLTRIKSICKVYLDRQRMASRVTQASCLSRRVAILAARCKLHAGSLLDLSGRMPKLPSSRAMPRNNELKKILLIGSGPIVIGQGCEFDYSGVQACKALREEGYEVVLVNSNPATIMTDPEFADRTYLEPITPEIIEAIMEREKPDAILPTLGGQTALNAAMELNRNGALARHGVKLIGANAQAIAKGEDRQLFKEAMLRIGLDLPRSGVARSVADLDRIVAEIGTFPLIIRPAFTLGGTGGGIAYNREELDVMAGRGLDLSPVREILIEESLVGWKEFEMEVMRDRMDNCVVVCSIENFDPMGVHTGDSITVAPVQTLTDKEYQIMRDAAFAVIREIGVETGGSNIQFAVHPETGRMVVIEMNPRVSRSSALASKATGFPIAKIAAKLAVGYTLDEIKNDITRETPACFEPTIDYCVVKVPRFTFEKFPQAEPTLTTRMKSVGEAMAIGRTFKEALQKALRSLEIKRFGLLGDGADRDVDNETLRLKLAIPNAERIFYIAQALQKGATIDEVYELTKIDRWFLRNLQQVVEEAAALRGSTGILFANRTDSSRGEPVGLAGVSVSARKSGCQPDSADEHLARQSTTENDTVEVNATVDARFRGLDPMQPIVQRRGHLPHWEQRGATYFVTFRLADSIPADLLAQWKQERATWLKLHPQPWDWKTAREYMRRFEEEREHWLDKGHGACLLRERRAAAIVADSLNHFDQQKYVLDAYVVMPNHVHVLFKPLGENSLADILHSWKSFTAQAVNREIGRAGGLWMHESFDTNCSRCRASTRVSRLHSAKSWKSATLPRRFRFSPAECARGKRRGRKSGKLPSSSLGLRDRLYFKRARCSPAE